MLYSHRIDWVDRMPVAHKDDGQMVPIPKDEPLRRECEHFLECMREKSKPRTDAASALQVLEVLDACERSLRNGGSPVELNAIEPSYQRTPARLLTPSARSGATQRFGTSPTLWTELNLAHAAISGKTW